MAMHTLQASGIACNHRPSAGQKACSPLSGRCHLSGRAALAPRSRPGCVASRQRSTLVTSAGLADRFFRVARSNTNYYGDKAAGALEDPARILDQAVREMTQDLGAMRSASAEVYATQRMLEERLAQAQREAETWYQRANLALSKGDDELAREALRRRKMHTTVADTLQKQLQQHTRATEQLTGNIRLMEGKLLEARNKKETLKARAAAAYASKQLNEDVTSLIKGLQYSGKSGLSAFAAMEERVVAMEVEAAALGELGAPAGLEAKFFALESNADDELGRMKADMRRAGRLPSSSSAAIDPVRTEIIWE